MTSMPPQPLPPLAQLAQCSQSPEPGAIRQMQQPQLSPQDMQDMIIAAQAMQQMQGGEPPAIPAGAIKMPKQSIIPMLIAGAGVIGGGVLGFASKGKGQFARFLRDAGRTGVGAVIGGAIGMIGASVVARNMAMKQLKAMDKMLAGMQGVPQQLPNSTQQPPQR